MILFKQINISYSNTNSIKKNKKNIEVTSLHCMDSFIGVLSALRSTYGIPISLVLFSVSPQIDDKLNSLSRCNINENVEIKDFHTKPSEYILGTYV